MGIAVVGSLNMDMVVTAPRIPLKGETILGKRLDYFPGGKGANQAYALGRLGDRPAMYGCVGSDLFAHRLIDSLAATNVCTDSIRRLDDEQTGVALITVGEADNTIVVVQGANSRVDRTYADTVKSDLLNSDLVMLQMEIPLDTVCYISAFCHQAGVPVLLNPAPAMPLPRELLDQVTWITPNEHEARQIFGHADALDILLRRYPGKLIVTLGKEGSAAATGDGQVLRVPAIRTRVVDTTGAGDTFNAAFAYAISRDHQLMQALLFANTAAGISTEKLGAQNGMPTLAQVLERLP